MGQTSGLPVKSPLDSFPKARNTMSSNEPDETGNQRLSAPSDRRSAPQSRAAQLPDKLLHGFHSRGALPHLKRKGASYFVTFRLAGTLPVEILLRLKREREAIIQTAMTHNRPLTWQEERELFNWYSDKVDKYLDAGHGECWLRQPEIAAFVADALRFFPGQRYTLSAWVITPNHVRVVVRPEGDWSLSQILKSWKLSRRAKPIYD